MGGVAAGLATAGVVDDQHALVVRRGRWVAQQQLKAPLVDLLVIPAGLGEEPLQALHGLVLGAGDRLGAGQRSERLVAVTREQQALQVGAEAMALGEPGGQGVELGGVGLEGAGCGWAGQALGHHDHLTGDDAPQPILPRKST